MAQKMCANIMRVNGKGMNQGDQSLMLEQDHSEETPSFFYAGKNHHIMSTLSCLFKTPT